MSSADLTTESVELSEGMLGLIGAYGLTTALDVRELYPRGASESQPAEPSASADAYTSEGVRPTATG